MAFEAPLRRLRLDSGLTQGELAARAGVSRQLVAAVEAGRNSPAVDTALALARALGTTVEKLFAAEGTAAASAVAAVEPSAGLPDGPLRVGRVGNRLVAAPLPDHGTAGAGWALADARWEAGAFRMLAGAGPAGFVVAGCEPALALAERLLPPAGPRSLMAVSAPTGAALRALGAGRVHGAVVHGPPGDLPAAPCSVRRIHFGRWRVGLGVAGRAAGGLEEILLGSLPLVERDPAAASQQALERARICANSSAGRRAGRGGAERGARQRAEGHLDAARRAAVLGGAGVTHEAAARAFGLAFVALEEHAVELWLAEDRADHPGAEALCDLLTQAAFTERVAQHGGYELADCGSRLGRLAAGRTPP